VTASLEVASSVAEEVKAASIGAAEGGACVEGA